MGMGGAGMSDTGSLESLRPLNMYGYSKHLFDLYAARLGWHKCTIGLKYFNVFGPNEDHKGEMRSVVHKSFAQVREHGVIRLFKSYRQEYADGEQKRDFLYVKDAIEMTLHLAASKSACGLYNIGSGEANSWNKLARTVFSALGMSPRVEYIEMPETFRDKYQYYTCADLTRLRAAGFNCPTHSLEAAVTDYLQNYLVADRRLGDGEGRLAKV